MLSRQRSRSQIRPSSKDGRNRLAKSRSSSRGPTPSRLSRRPSKLDIYLQKSSRRNSCVSLGQDNASFHAAMTSREPKRWDGVTRTAEHWDSLRRDGELWLAEGDCLIRFYEKGSSRRGASLRVFYSDIESSDCRPFLNQYTLDMVDPAHAQLVDSDRRSRFSGFYEGSAPLYEMHIPAPSHLSREEALQYHLTTRNFFAWMYNRPLTGDHLGQAIIRLQKRMDEYRPDAKDNQATVLSYIDDQGYLDFRHCPDHALAILQYAENFKLPKLWTDAFVHCAGMHDELEASSEWTHISRSSQALITRAHIEMDIRLERAGRSLEEFLENDIPCANFKFSRQANMHLERFRSFLQCYYIGRYGYWPPTADEDGETTALPKSVYQSMYFDMRNLYEYLADKGSEPACQMEISNDQSLNVSGNLQAFDIKNRYTSLPFSTVLLPDLPEPIQKRKSIWNIFGFSRVKQEKRLAAFSALKDATNHDDHRVMASNIVREYLRFERDWTMMEDPTYTCVEARKVRWILIYTMLQTLVSVAKVPEEVRDTEGVTYPLCCQTAGTPPWNTTSPEEEDLIDEQQQQQQQQQQAIRQPSPVSSLTPTPDEDLPLPTPDFPFLRPNPLKVPTTRLSTPYRLPRNNRRPSTSASTSHIRVPARATSFDFLREATESLTLKPKSPARRRRAFTQYHSSSHPDLRALAVRPPLPTDLPSTASSGSQASSSQSPILSDCSPSTPSSSEPEMSAWSASSSDGGMDHNSVLEMQMETESNYSDDHKEVDAAAKPAQKLRSSSQAIKAMPSHSSMWRRNPELEAFLAA